MRRGILVGGGAYKARKEIEIYALVNRIPVFRTWNALDVITDDSEVYGGTVGTYGGPGRNFGIQNCDELLVLGSRISGRITGGQPKTFARAAVKTIVDLEPHSFDRSALQDGDEVIKADCAEFIRQVPYPAKTPSSDWLDQCRRWVKEYDPVSSSHLNEWHHYGVMRSLSRHIPQDAIVTYDTGGNSIMMGHCFQSKRGQRIFSSNGNTPMGFSMCGAIGAWFAEPKRPVFCIIGDGGMQLNIQELQTIVHYRIPLKVFIFNNGILGNTKAYQRVNGKPEIACGPDGYSAPNFPAIAYGYGIEAMSIRSWVDWHESVNRAISFDGPLVVDVVDMDRCDYQPRISRWDTPIEDMQPFLPREEFRAQMYIEPLSGWEKNV